MMHDNDSSAVVVGIDTHADTHHVAVITNYGRPLVDVMVPATSAEQEERPWHESSSGPDS